MVGSVLDGDWSKRDFVKLVLYFMFKVLRSRMLFIPILGASDPRERACLPEWFLFVDGILLVSMKETQKRKREDLT